MSAVSPHVVSRAAGRPSIARPGGVTTRPCIGRWNTADAPITTGTTSFPRRGTVALHTHNVGEVVLVLEGQATLIIGNATLELETGDASWVPEGLPHRFSNRGEGALVIYWVYAGRQVTRTIWATGETKDHLPQS